MILKKVYAIIVLLLSLASIAAAQPPQNKPADQEQPLKLKTDLIELRVVVTDKKGQPIDNLKQADFEILEDGKPQQVSFFSVEHVTDKPNAAAAAAPDKPRTATPGPATAPARTIVLFVDALHLSTFSWMRAKKQLRQFIDEQMTDQDLVAVVSTWGTLGVLQQFMRNRAMLKHALDKIPLFSTRDSDFTPYLAARVLSTDEEAISLAIAIVAKEDGAEFRNPTMAQAYVEARANEILGMERNWRMATLQSLKGVSDRLAEMPGQRIIAFVSDGFTMLDAGMVMDNDSVTAVTGRAARSGVVIYSFDAQGLAVPPDNHILSAGRNDEQSLLRTLAYDTGGEPFLNRNDMNIWLQKMLDANRIYYALAYYAADDKDPKKFRKLKIRVKDHPEYEVRAQKGYVPAEAKKEEVAAGPREVLFKAMVAPLPVTAIGVTAAAEFLEREDDDAQALLRIHLDGKTLQFTPQDVHHQFNGEVAITVYEPSGKVSESSAEALRLTLTEQQFERVKREGFSFSRRLKLSPGIHQVRVGILDAKSQSMGTAMAWVEVPDLRKGKLAMSSIFLGKEQKAGGAATAERGPARLQPLFDNASFRPGESVFYRTVIYNVTNDANAVPAMLKVQITGDGKTVYDGDWQDVAARTMRKDKKGIEVGGQLKLGLAPGVYDLTVSVKDHRSKKPVQQTVSFEIEGQ
ncbi:MAG TPA: VWA domain-containing protein [Blastocatellia bacterium]|nr:VWA domain-containing protein [Blastocatellia bacterium]